jgi:hypothetical protein
MSRAAAAIPAIHVSTAHIFACGHSMVPHFNSNALNLCLYFDEVEALSTNAGLNYEGKIWHTLRHTSQEDNKLWATLPKALEQTMREGVRGVISNG